MRSLVPVVFSLCALTVAPGDARAQSTPASEHLLDYARLRQLAATDPWESTLARRAVAHDSGSRLPQLRLLPVDLRTSFNSARPWGTNDGAIWQGRGATLAVSGGISARWGRFSAALRPMAIYNENRAFELSPIAVPTGLSPFAYPTGLSSAIDMPQRFGEGSFRTFDLGPSFLRAEFGAVALGLSNENRWWGPGRRNAIVMTNNAPGFKHAFLGTSRPVDVKIGSFESEWLWGRLRESEYFDADGANDRRFFTGLKATFSPKGLPDLELGATRTFITAWPSDGISAADLFMVFLPLEKADLMTPDNPSGDDAADQMASLFFRWKFPASAFELYGEWGRGDHSLNVRDLFVEPEHASAWMFGMQKGFARGEELIWRFSTEVTILGAARTATLRPPPSAFYVHHIVRQGYTSRGQVMGAGIGPGSSQLFAGLDRFAPWGKASVGFLRTVYDNNRFYATPRSWDTHEVEPSFLAEALVFHGPWDLTAGLVRSRLLNQFYIQFNDETNVNVTLGARYHFGAR